MQSMGYDAYPVMSDIDWELMLFGIPHNALPERKDECVQWGSLQIPRISEAASVIRNEILGLIDKNNHTEPNSRVAGGIASALNRMSVFSNPVATRISTRRNFLIVTR